MGNGTSNVRVRFDERDGTFQEEKSHRIDRSNKVFQGKYLEVTHTITYFNDNHKYDLYVTLSQDTDPFFVYYNPSKEHRVNEVKSYFLKSNQSRVLLVTFKTTHETFTYRYYDLLWAKETDTIRVPNIDNIHTTEFQNELEEEELAIVRETELAGKHYSSGYTCIYLGMNPDVTTRYVVEVGTGVKCVIVVTWDRCDYCRNVRILKFKVRHYGDKLYSVWDNTWYQWSNSMYYVYFYTGSDVLHPGQHIFTYYPRSNRYVIVHVEAFFANMDPTFPFCIGFKLRRGENIYTRYGELVDKGSGYNYDFASIFDRDIEKRVKDSFSQTFKTFKFQIGNYLNTHVVINPSDDLPEHRLTIGSDKTYKKVVFKGDNTTPQSWLRQMFDCRMFTINAGDESCKIKGSKDEPQTYPIKNKRLSSSTLAPVKDGFFYGVVVYYTNIEITRRKALENISQGIFHQVDLLEKYPLNANIAILIDFIIDCNTRTQFVRQNVEGTKWETKTVDYGVDSDLVTKLNEIVEDLRISEEKKRSEHPTVVKGDRETGSQPDEKEESEESEDDDDDYEEEEEEEEEDEEEVIEKGPTQILPETERSPPGLPGEKGKSPPEDHRQKETGSRESKPFEVRLTGTVTERGSSSSMMPGPQGSGKLTPTKTEATKPVAAKPAPARPPQASSHLTTSSRTPTTTRVSTHTQAPSSTSGHPSGHPAASQKERKKEKPPKAKDKGPKKKTKHQQTGPPVKKQEHKGTKVIFILIEETSSYKLTDPGNFSYLLKDIDKYNLMNHNETIEVKNKENDVCKHLKYHGYYVVEHDFKNVLQQVLYTPDSVELKIFIKEHEAYRDLRLYPSENNFNPFSLYYQSNNNILQVYFSNGYTKPLLFCYNGSGYRPTTESEYVQNWVKDPEILECRCNQTSYYHSQQILDALNKIKQFLKKYQKIQQIVYDNDFGNTEYGQYSQQRQDGQAESGGPSAGTIAGASVGSLVTTAAVSGGVTLAFRPELIITSIKALL